MSNKKPISLMISMSFFLFYMRLNERVRDVSDCNVPILFGVNNACG